MNYSQYFCRSGALAAIKGDSPLGATGQAIVIAIRGEGAAPTNLEQVVMNKLNSYRSVLWPVCNASFWMC